jgi:hypothetical protein
VLCDPLCGSGTIAIEAALMATDTAPGLIRYGSTSNVAGSRGFARSGALRHTETYSGADTLTSTAPARRGTRQDYTRGAPYITSDPHLSGDGREMQGSHFFSATVPAPLRWLDIRDEAGPQWEAALSAARSRDQRHPLRNAARANTVEKKTSVSAITQVAVATKPAKNTASSEHSPHTIRILANDRHAGSTDLARQAAELAGVDHLVDFSCEDIEHYIPSGGVDVIVTNPPWEKRLEDGLQAWEKLAAFMRRVGRRGAGSVAAVAKDALSTSAGVNGTSQVSDSRSSNRETTRVPDSASADMIPCAWVLSGNPDLEQVKGLDRPAQRIPLRVATMEARFNQYLPYFS